MRPYAELTAMMFRVVERLGTVRLLQLTAKLNKQEREELLEYIGKLEDREVKLLRAIESLVRECVPNKPG
jgi:hypothetical protein